MYKWDIWYSYEYEYFVSYMLYKQTISCTKRPSAGYTNIRQQHFKRKLASYEHSVLTPATILIAYIHAHINFYPMKSPLRTFCEKVLLIL